MVFVQIEAVSFQNFLERGELITREQVQDLFVSKKPIVVQSSAGQPIEVPVGFVSLKVCLCLHPQRLR